jgi:hypothetical protein
VIFIMAIVIKPRVFVFVLMTMDDGPRITDFCCG